MLRKLRVSRQRGESVQRQTILFDESCVAVAYGILGMCSAAMADMLMRWDPLGGQKFRGTVGCCGSTTNQDDFDGHSTLSTSLRSIVKMSKTCTRQENPYRIDSCHATRNILEHIVGVVVGDNPIRQDVRCYGRWS